MSYLAAKGAALANLPNGLLVALSIFKRESCQGRPVFRPRRPDFRADHGPVHCGHQMGMAKPALTTAGSAALGYRDDLAVPLLDRH